MPITIRFASWNIENYGTSKNTKSPDLPKLIAKTMEIAKIDILAVLEMQNNGYVGIHKKILAELKSSGYNTNWQEEFVKVGDEGVAFFWHEATSGTNAFAAKKYTNNAAEPIAEKVLKDNAGSRIYFPKTQTLWNSLPGKQDGRRPAFCAFETNIGGTASTFTFLDIHAPFNKTTLIQAYSAYLYPTSREVSQVQTFDAIHAFKEAKTPAQTEVENAIGTQFTGASSAQKQAVASKAIDAINSQQFIDKWRDEIVAGIDFKRIAKEAAKVAAASAAQEAKVQGFNSLTSASGSSGEEAIVEAGAAAGAAAATYIFAEASTTPNPANEAAIAATKAVSNVSYVPPAKKPKTPTGISTAAKNAAADAAEDGVNAINLSSIGGSHISPVTASALAGDFNIDYPDSGATYPAPVGNPPDGAYDKLLKLPSVAAINEKTTQRGGKKASDFSRAKIYVLKSPNPLDPIPPSTIPNGVPQDVYDVVNALKGQEFLGYEKWLEALQAEATKQGVPWSKMVQYYDKINNAFDKTKDLNQTEYFRVSAYDNIFVKGATITPGSGESIDVLDELGDWPADTSAGNYWVASKGNLNAIASPFLTGLQTPDINANLRSAADAAAFYKVYMSDHYPVIVEVTIP